MITVQQLICYSFQSIEIVKRCSQPSHLVVHIVCFFLLILGEHEGMFLTFLIRDVHISHLMVSIVLLSVLIIEDHEGMFLTLGMFTNLT
jgi:hypothetical protein